MVTKSKEGPAPEGSDEKFPAKLPPVSTVETAAGKEAIADSKDTVEQEAAPFYDEQAEEGFDELPEGATLRGGSSSL